MADGGGGALGRCVADKTRTPGASNPGGGIDMDDDEDEDADEDDDEGADDAAPLSGYEDIRA